MPSKTGPKNKRVVAVAYDGLCTFEFGVATELFGLARPELDVAWYDFSVVAIEPGPLRIDGGLTLTAPYDLEAISSAGTVVVPGWRDPEEPPPDDLLDALRQAHQGGARLLSICSGVFVLAATGLLDNLDATTHWRYTDQLSAMYPTVSVLPDQLFVDNGSVLTSAGSAAGLDLGLHLIGRDYGQAVANQVARRLVLPTQRDGGQAQFIHRPPEPDGSAGLAEVTEWMLENLDRPISVGELANQACLSERTFARHFKQETGRPPLKWLTHQRVLRAQTLLETTDYGIEEVAQLSGFGAAATLRQHFQAQTQTTPSQYRLRFSLGAS